jgi:hypothetical protein
LVFIYPIMNNLDQTWHSPMFSIWSAVEMNVAIFCSCAPTLKGLVQRVWPQFLKSLGSRYGSRGSRGTSGREDSGATAVNSTSTSSSEFLRKPKDDSQAESQSPQKSSHGLLGFRRSLFKPFFSGTNNSCYGSKASEDDIMFENVTRSSTRSKGSATTSKAYHEEKGIEVHTVVDQIVQHKPQPEPEAHRTIVGAGDNVKDPFDDDEDERMIQKAAWSS